MNVEMFTQSQITQNTRTVMNIMKAAKTLTSRTSNSMPVTGPMSGKGMDAKIHFGMTAIGLVNNAKIHYGMTAIGMEENAIMPKIQTTSKASLTATQMDTLMA